MQKSSVKRLLNKKVWTGEEVGRAILIRLMDDLVRPDQAPSITQADMDRMHNSLATSAQREVYYFFSSVYDTIQELGIMQRASGQSFKHGHYLEQSILNTFVMDNVLANQQLKTPVYMTPEHYEQLKQEYIEQIKKEPIDYWCAFYNVLLFIDKAPYEIQLTVDECAEEPVSNEKLLSHMKDAGLTEEYFNKQTAIFSFLEWYFDDIEGDTRTVEEQFQEFKDDYPKAFAAIDKYLRTFPVFKDITTEEYLKPVTTLMDLTEQGFMAADEIRDKLNTASIKSIRDYIVCDKDEYSTEYKIKVLLGGIVLTIEGDPAETPADYCRAGEETMVHIAKDYEEAIPAIQMTEYALKTMYAFNAVIGAFVKCFGLDMLEDIKNDMQEYEEDVKQNSDIILKLKTAVCGTPEEKAEKLHIIETAFPLIDVEKLKPSPEKIEELEKLLNGVTYSTGQKLVKRNAFVHYMLYLMGDAEEVEYGK